MILKSNKNITFLCFIFLLQSDTQNKLEDIKHLREQMKTVAEETRAKDDIQKQLVSRIDRDVMYKVFLILDFLQRNNSLIEKNVDSVIHSDRQ